ncbi:MAG TPA: sulfatase, partial [Rhodothermales bacterium]
VGFATVAKRASDDRAAIAALQTPAPGTPNVLLIVWDTARALNMSLYGYERETTPNLARRAADGIVFDHVLSPASWTLPAHASMFTGRWHHELSANWFVPLDDEFPTLAEVLTDRGIATAGFAANVSYVSFKHGLDRGFIHYEDFPVSAGQIALSSALARLFVGWNWLRGLIEHHRALNQRTADEVNEIVLDWIDEHSDRTFFVFANYFDAHEPLLPPEPFHSRFGPRRPWGPFEHGMNAGDHADKDNRPAEDVRMMIDRYDASIAYLDDAFDRLLAHLEDRGLLENTLVILTADHGEHWGEKELFDHGNSLYQQLLYVPLVVLPPRGHERGIRVEAPVSTRDIPATVLHYLNQPNGIFPGQSLTRLHHGQAVPDTLLARLDTESRHARAVAIGPYKYMWMTVAGEPRRDELFQYFEDPFEENNLFDDPQYQGLVAEMDSTLKAQMKSSSVVLPVEPTEPPVQTASARP